MKRLFLILTILFVSSAAIVHAAETDATSTPRLYVPIGGMDTIPTNPANYINTIYKWGLGLAALVALARLVMGGVLKTLSAGNVVEEGAANEVIKDGIYGIILLVSIGLLLSTINPKLTNISLPTLEKIDIPGADASLNPNSKVGPVGRLNQNTSAEPSEAYAAMRKQIDQYLNRRNANQPADIHDVTGKLDRQAYGPDDFYEYMELAMEAAKDGKPIQRDGYRDAVIAAVRYAKQVMDPASFAEVTKIMKAQTPPELMASEYLKDDPFQRNSIAPTGSGSAESKQSELDLINLEVKNGLNDLQKDEFAEMKKMVDQGDFEKLGEYTVSDLINEAPVRLIVRYAKLTLEPTSYESFKRELINNGVRQIMPSLVIPD